MKILEAAPCGVAIICPDKDLENPEEALDQIEAFWETFWPEFLDGVSEGIDGYGTGQELGERLKFIVSDAGDNELLLRLELGVPVWDAFVSQDGDMTHFQPVF